MAEYRIDELARAAGVTVRNIRVYQDRGILPPPRREGRVAIYSDAHLARLRVIGQMLDRGYTFAHIAELVAAWEQGRDISEVLGLEAAITDPWSDELPGYATADELLEMLGDEATEATIARALELELVVPEGDRFRIPSPRELHAGVELVRAGIPLETVLDLAAEVRRTVDEASRQLVQAVADHILADREPDWLPSGEEIPELAALIHRLRPLAQMAVDGRLARSMQQQVQAVLGERIARLAGDPDQASPATRDAS